MCIKLQDQNVLVYLKPLQSFSVAANAIVVDLSNSLCSVFAVQISDMIDSASCHLLFRLVYAQLNFDAFCHQITKAVAFT